NGIRYLHQTLVSVPAIEPERAPFTWRAGNDQILSSVRRKRPHSQSPEVKTGQRRQHWCLTVDYTRRVVDAEQDASAVGDRVAQANPQLPLRRCSETLNVEYANGLGSHLSRLGKVEIGKHGLAEYGR